MFNNLLDHGLRVCLTLLECRVLVDVLEGLELEGEALILDEVPVEDVEFGDVHGVQDLQDRIDCVVATGCVEHQSTIRVPWEVTYLQGSVCHRVVKID